jgi:predicted  nucleic acid-binding Zn-ribbon protein
MTVQDLQETIRNASAEERRDIEATIREWAAQTSTEEEDEEEEPQSLKREREEEEEEQATVAIDIAGPGVYSLVPLSRQKC